MAVFFNSDPTERKSRKYIQLALEAKNKKQNFHLFFLIRKSGKYAGSTRFYDINLNKTFYWVILGTEEAF
jgi:hypothetical protein